MLIISKPLAGFPERQTIKTIRGINYTSSISSKNMILSIGLGSSRNLSLFKSQLFLLENWVRLVTLIWPKLIQGLRVMIHKKFNLSPTPKKFHQLKILILKRGWNSTERTGLVETYPTINFQSLTRRMRDESILLPPKGVLMISKGLSTLPKIPKIQLQPTTHQEVKTF